MANLHKFTVQESLNASQGNAGNWSVQTAAPINANSGATVHHPISSSTHILLLQPTLDTQISFTTSEADIVNAADIVIFAANLTSINVPRGLGGDIILNIRSNTTTGSGTMKIVEV